MSMTLQDESVAELLKGKPVEMSVGEPWDFESSAGPNRLEGRIVSVALYGAESRRQAVTVEITPFTASNGAVVTELKAEARYEEDQETFVAQVADRRRVAANLDYSGHVSSEELPGGASPFLVGSVWLATRPPAPGSS